MSRSHNILIQILLSILLIIPVSITAQNYKYNYELFTKDNGLPSNWIYDIDFNSEGHMWLCTQNGVTFYDRNAFKPQPQISSDNRYLKLKVDVNDNLWLLHGNYYPNNPTVKNLIFYNTQTKEKNSVWDAIPNAKEILPGNDIFNLWNDQSKNIYIQSTKTKEIFYFDGKKISTTNIKATVPYKDLNLKLENAIVYLEDNKYYLFDIKTGVSEPYNISLPHTPLFYNQKPFIKIVSDQKEQSQASKYGYDNYYKILDLNNEIILDSIQSAFRYTQINESIYLSTRNNLIQIDAKTKEVKDINQELRGVFTDNKIKILTTYGEELWASTYKGLYKIIKTQPSFYNAAYGENSNVRNIRQLDQENIILATHRGIVKINLSNGEETTILENLHGYGLTAINSFRYIISSHSPALFDWNILDKKLSRVIRPRNKISSKLDSLNIFLFCHIDHNNNAWLTNTNGIYKFNIDDGVIEKIAQKSDKPAYYLAMIAHPTDKNKIFITKQNGLDELNLITETIRSFPSLGERQITDIKIDCNDPSIYWVSTNFDGLLKWKYDDKILNQYTLEHGLKSMNVHSAKQDYDGNVWMSTDYGISILDTLTSQITTLTTANGIHENEFNRHSHLSIGDSIFVYGSIDGITYFKPNNLTRKLNKASIEIIGLEYTDELSGRVELNENIEDQNTLKINANSINPILKLRPSFNKVSSTVRYLFTSKKQNWQYSQSNTIPLNDLKDGENILLLSRQQNVKSWSEPKTITIIKSTPFYKNIWSYILFAASILLSAIYYQRIKEKRLLKRSEEIQKQVDEKTLELFNKNETLQKANELNNDLFDIIGHDLRSPITSLTNITKSLAYLSKNGTPEETAKLGKAVDKNAQKLLTTVDKLIRWSKLKRDSEIKLESVAIYTLVEDILLTYENNINAKRLVINTEEISKSIITVTDYGSLRSILKNIISNALKFSKTESKISIIAKQNKVLTTLIIKDLGLGISEKQIESIFSNQSTSSSIGTDGEAGLGIGLKNSIKLLERLGGTIRFTPNSPRGTIVEVNLPYLIV